MSKRWLIVAGIILVVAVLMVGAGVVMAQEPTPTPNAPAWGLGPRAGWGQGMWGALRGAWSGNFGPMRGRGNFGPMGGAWGGNFGPFGQQGYGFGPMGGRGGPENSLISIAAEKLEMTPADLLKELQAGKTMAEVAADHNVTVETLVDTFLAPRSERLAELVSNGQVTQEQADAWLAEMKEHVTDQINGTWSPRGWGRGAGFVDENGDGICDCRQTPNNAQQQ